MTDHIENHAICAPQSAAEVIHGQLLSVKTAPDEDAEWYWSHDPVRGSYIAGYQRLPHSA